MRPRRPRRRTTRNEAGAGPDSRCCGCPATSKTWPSLGPVVDRPLRREDPAGRALPPFAGLPVRGSAAGFRLYRRAAMPREGVGGRCAARGGGPDRGSASLTRAAHQDARQDAADQRPPERLVATVFGPTHRRASLNGTTWAPLSGTASKSGGHEPTRPARRVGRRGQLGLRRRGRGPGALAGRPALVGEGCAVCLIDLETGKAVNVSDGHRYRSRR